MRTDVHGPAVFAHPPIQRQPVSAAILGDTRLSGRGNGPLRAAAIQRLQQTGGNRTTRQFMQRLAQGTAPAAPRRPLVVQRRILPLGDLHELLTKNSSASLEERKSAEIITKAVGHHQEATKDKIARPDDTKGWWLSSKRGALHDLKSGEELKIFGHGEIGVKGGPALQIGGYTPEKLVETLIALEVPKTYSGLIYLTGCVTAVGGDKSFLNRFYALIINHAPAVKVKGNLDTTTTLHDGTQGVWTGKMSKEEYTEGRKKLVIVQNDLGGLTGEARKEVDSFNLTMKEDLEKWGKLLTANTISQKEYTEGTNKIMAKRGDLIKNYGTLIDQWKNATSNIQKLERTAYDITGALTRTLP